MEFWIIFNDILILLGASLIAGTICSRLGQSPVVGYLLAGTMLGGPGSFRLVSSQHAIESISELGVALLLFSLGLEFSAERIKKLGIKSLIAGILQVIATLIFVALIAFLIGYTVTTSLGIGALVALSSTAVVLRILQERIELDMPHGRNCLGVLLTQDMAVIPLALLLTILGGNGGTVEVLQNIGTLLLLTLVLVAGLFIATRIAVATLGTLTLHRNRELTIIFAIVAGLGSAHAAHLAGISPALGAFVAGMMLGSSPFATQIMADISPLQVLLITLFFGSAGMVADPIWIVQNWDLVLGVTTLLFIGKFLIVSILFIALGQNVRIAAATGICLAQVGEFAFVLGNIGRGSGVISEELFALIVSVAIISFLMTAILVPRASRLGDFIASLLGKKSSIDSLDKTQEVKPEIAFIGFGPAAQIASKELLGTPHQVTVIDLNYEGVKLAKESGFHAHVGDGQQFEVLEHSGIKNCTVVLITVPHHATAMQILYSVRRVAPHAHTIVRSRYNLHSNDFVSAGAHVVCDDEQEVGSTLSLQLQNFLETMI